MITSKDTIKTCDTCGHSVVFDKDFKHSCTEILLKRLALAESVIDKVIPSDMNQRQMLFSYKFFTKNKLNLNKVKLK